MGVDVVAWDDGGLEVEFAGTDPLWGEGENVGGIIEEAGEGGGFGMGGYVERAEELDVERGGLKEGAGGFRVGMELRGEGGDGVLGECRMPKFEEDLGGDGVSGGERGIGGELLSEGDVGGGIWGKEEGGAGGVEAIDHMVTQVLGLLVAVDFEEGLDKEGVVVEEGMGLVGGVSEGAVGGEVLGEEELGGVMGGVSVSGLGEGSAGMGEGANHEGVPAGDDLGVEGGLFALLACVVEALAKWGEELIELIFGELEFVGEL